MTYLQPAEPSVLVNLFANVVVQAEALGQFLGSLHLVVVTNIPRGTFVGREEVLVLYRACQGIGGASAGRGGGVLFCYLVESFDH